MGQTGAWFFLLLLGILLIIIGFEGALGKIFAVAFAPALLVPQQKQGNPGDF